MNPLKLRDQWGYSEANKNGWIRLCDSALGTKTGHKISSKNGTLGATKLGFLVYGKGSEKYRVIRLPK